MYRLEVHVLVLLTHSLTMACLIGGGHIRCGTLNIHPSLLPKYRGASPVQRTLEAGDEGTVGVVVVLVLWWWCWCWWGQWWCSPS